MKLQFDREKFWTAFQTASAVVAQRSPKPILQNVKLEAGQQGSVLVATDLEIGVRVQVPAVECEAPGAAILSPNSFGAILRQSSDASLRLESDGQTLVVRGDRSEFKLPAVNPDEFPSVAEFAETKYHELPARLLREVIRRTVFATDNESSRYALGGVLFEFSGDQIIAVGTDGRRLARMQAPARAVGGHETPASSTIVPAKALQLIERSLTDQDADVQIAARANDLLLKSSRMSLNARLVEGRFPRWRDVFPAREGVTRIELLVGPFHAAVRQAGIATNTESRGVDFSFESGRVVMSGRAADVGQARIELPVSFDGAPVGISLDPKYVSDFLKVIDPDGTFHMELRSSETAAVCGTEDGYGYVIMPLQRQS